jgi:hypothetical protein
MPDFVYDIPLNDLATYFAVVAVLAIVIGMLIVKPLLRLLMGSGSNLNTKRLAMAPQRSASSTGCCWAC